MTKQTALSASLEFNRTLWKNDRAVGLLGKLAILAEPNDGVYEQSKRAMASRLCVSPGTLDKYLRLLEEAGALSAQKTPYGWTRITLTKRGKKPQEKPTAKPVQTRQSPVQRPNTPVQDLSAGVQDFDSSAQDLDIGVQDLDSSVQTPGAENPPTPPYMVANSILTTTTTTTPHNPPPGNMPEEFTAFWQAYPNKQGKDAALKVWKRQKHRFADIRPALLRQQELRDWVKSAGQYIPRASTYLHKKRYLDDLPAGAEHYVLDFKTPQSPREKLAVKWLKNDNPALLQCANKKINAVFEDTGARAALENLYTACGEDFTLTLEVMREGYRAGCRTLASIASRAGFYRAEIESKRNQGR